MRSVADQYQRLLAKNLDQVFGQAMQEGLNCSPFEAQIMVEKVHEIYAPLLDGNSLKPGQIQMSVLSARVPASRPLRQAAQVRVTLTLDGGAQDLRTRQGRGVPALRQQRLLRMAEEAFQQGGVMTLEDLARLFNCGVRTLSNDLAALRQEGSIPPLRSQIQDMGRAVSHRAQIVRLWLAGRQYSSIARHTHHSITSVRQYVNKYQRVQALHQEGFPLQTIAFLAAMSPTLVQAFLQLEVPHPQRPLPIGRGKKNQRL